MNILQDKKFLRTMITLALPITIQCFITSSLNLVDNVMIGKLGEAPIAAVGLANQYFFIFMLCIGGINAGASVFMSQYWGKRDVKNIHKVLGLDITVGFIASSIFAIGAFFFSDIIMNILSNDIEVINLGSLYLKIAAISYFFTNFTQGYSSALRSTEQTKLPMYGSLLAVLCNAFLNWIFIFGNLGFPEMGVAGAALATTLARFIEMLFIILIVYIKKNKVASNIKELFSFDFNFVKVYFNTSTSVIINEIIYSCGVTAYSIAYAQIGTSEVATMQIATTLINMFMVLCTGLANAAAIMVGNKIGAKEEEEAIEYAKKLGLISPIIGLTLGIIIWLTAPMILKVFNITPETYSDAIKVLRVMAVFCAIRTYNVVMIVGVFRGGGDTTYSMLVQAATIWLYAVPIAFISAMLWSVPIYIVYLFICLEEIIKLGFEISRLRSGKWLNNVVE